MQKLHVRTTTNLPIVSYSWINRTARPAASGHSAQMFVDLKLISMIYINGSSIKTSLTVGQADLLLPNRGTSESRSVPRLHRSISHVPADKIAIKCTRNSARGKCIRSRDLAFGK